MKKIKFLSPIALLVLAFASCDKADLSTTETILPTDKALIRVAMLSPGTPPVMLKANDVKFGNTTSTNVYFPATTGFPDYVAIPANSTLKLSLPFTGTQNDSVVIFNSQLNVDAGKYYSVTLADTGVNRTAFAIEDQFLPHKDSFISIRLINAMVGSTLNLIRVDSTSASDFVRDTLARNIPYKGTSGFIQVKTFTTRSFIRIRVSTNDGKVYGGTTVAPFSGGLIPPQTAATGSRRSITYYATGFLNGTGTFAPSLVGHITNQ